MVSANYENEPIRGLPGLLPAGEQILWQGAPDWKRLALTAFHVRGVGLYFVALALWAMIAGSGASGIVTTFVAGALCIGLLYLFAWMVARSTVYTLTNKRVVLRMGVALPKCVNIPHAIIANAAVKQHGDGSADIPLQLKGPDRMGYLMLWPHARPWKIAAAEPMLRAVPDGEAVAAKLARALAESVPDGRRTPLAASGDNGISAGEAAIA